MARTATRSSSTRVKVVRVPGPTRVVQAAPRRRRSSQTVVVSSPRAVTHRRSRGHAGVGGVGTLTPAKLLSMGLGGAIFGFIESKFPNLPTLPVVGRSGTVAIAAYLFSKHGGGTGGSIVKDVAVAASVITGYQLGKTGKVSGADVVGDDLEGEEVYEQI
jgi:hypothetical protein